MNSLSGDFDEAYKKTVQWKDINGNFCRHNGLPNLKTMPVDFQIKYERIFKYAQFFQRWLKPVLAECIATFMLGIFFGQKFFYFQFFGLACFSLALKIQTTPNRRSFSLLLQE